MKKLFLLIVLMVGMNSCEFGMYPYTYDYNPRPYYSPYLNPINPYYPYYYYRPYYYKPPYRPTPPSNHHYGPRK